MAKNWIEDGAKTEFYPYAAIPVLVDFANFQLKIS